MTAHAHATADARATFSSACASACAAPAPAPAPAPLPQVNICAIAKNEARYLAEWCLFHHLVGIRHITIYDNNSLDAPSADSTRAVLAPFISSGFVDLIPWPLPNPSQFLAYQNYLTWHRGRAAWTAFIDCDEFLLPATPAHATVPDALAAILADLSSRSLPLGALAVNWLCFGAGGQQTYSPLPVIERFTWRDLPFAPVNLHIKSLVWMDQPSLQTGATPHHFLTSPGLPTRDELGREVPDSFTLTHSSALLRLHHYSSKSREEWEERVALGKPDRPPDSPIDPRWWEDRQVMAEEDRTAWRWLAEVKRGLGLLDSPNSINERISIPNETA